MSSCQRQESRRCDDGYLTIPSIKPIKTFPSYSSHSRKRKRQHQQKERPSEQCVQHCLENEESLLFWTLQPHPTARARAEVALHVPPIDNNKNEVRACSPTRRRKSSDKHKEASTPLIQRRMISSQRERYQYHCLWERHNTDEHLSQEQLHDNIVEAIISVDSNLNNKQIINDKHNIEIINTFILERKKTKRRGRTRILSTMLLHWMLVVLISCCCCCYAPSSDATTAEMITSYSQSIVSRYNIRASKRRGTVPFVRKQHGSINHASNRPSSGNVKTKPIIDTMNILSEINVTENMFNETFPNLMRKVNNNVFDTEQHHESTLQNNIDMKNKKRMHLNRGTVIQLQQYQQEEVEERKNLPTSATKSIQRNVQEIWLRKKKRYQDPDVGLEYNVTPIPAPVSKPKKSLVPPAAIEEFPAEGEQPPPNDDDYEWDKWLETDVPTPSPILAYITRSPDWTRDDDGDMLSYSQSPAPTIGLSKQLEYTYSPTASSVPTWHLSTMVPAPSTNAPKSAFPTTLKFVSPAPKSLSPTRSSKNDAKWVNISVPCQFIVSLPLSKRRSRKAQVTTATSSRKEETGNSLNTIKNALEDYLTDILQEAFQDHKNDVLLQSVQLAVIWMGGDKKNYDRRSRNLQQIDDEYIDLNVSGEAEYTIDETSIDKDEFLSASDDIITRAVGDEGVLQQIIDDAGVDGNDVLDDVTSVSSTGEDGNNDNDATNNDNNRDGDEVDSNSTKNDKPTLAEIIIGFSILGLALASIAFWCVTLYKKYRKKQRRKRLAALRKQGSLTMGGGGSRRPGPNNMDNPKITNNVRGQTGNEPLPRLLLPDGGSNQNNIGTSGSGTSASMRVFGTTPSMTIVGMDANSPNGHYSSDDDDSNYPLAMMKINPSVSSSYGSPPVSAKNNNLNYKNSSDQDDDDDDISEFTRELKNAATLDQQLWKEKQMKELAKTAVQSKKQQQNQSGVLSKDLNNMSPSDYYNKGWKSGQSPLSAATSDSDDDLVNTSFPYGDEESNNNKNSSNPQSGKSHGILDDDLEDVELAVNDAVEWTESGRMKIAIGQSGISGSRNVPDKNNTSDAKENFSPYGNDSINNHKGGARSLAQSWDLDENPVRDESGPSQYSFIYPLKRQDVESTGDSSRGVSDSSALAVHESAAEVTSIGSVVTPLLQQKQQHKEDFKTPKTNNSRVSVSAAAEALLRSAAAMNLDDDGSSDSSSVSEHGIHHRSITVTDDTNKSEMEQVELTRSMIQEVNEIAHFVEQYERAKGHKLSFLRREIDEIQKLASMSGSTDEGDENDNTNNFLPSTLRSNSSGFKGKVTVFSPKSMTSDIMSYDAGTDDDDDNDDDEYDIKFSGTNNTDDDDGQQRLGISRIKVDIPPLKALRNAGQSMVDQEEDITTASKNQFHRKEEGVATHEQQQQQEDVPSSPLTPRTAAARLRSKNAFFSSIITMFDSKKTETVKPPATTTNSWQYPKKK